MAALRTPGLTSLVSSSESKSKNGAVRGGRRAFELEATAFGERLIDAGTGSGSALTGVRGGTAREDDATGNDGSVGSLFTEPLKDSDEKEPVSSHSYEA